MDFLHVRLRAPARSLPSLTAFYCENLGIEPLGATAEELVLAVGPTRLEFVSSPAEAFYHFALLVPGDRFAEALEWAAERTELLPDSETGEVVFDFSNWRAWACYFHDPAGTIVELIAHSGIGEAGARGAFTARELLGFSELGVVGDTRAMAAALKRGVGLEVWDGSFAPGRLAFVGERARTLILSPAGRPWLPTGRPAEAHPLEAVLADVVEGEAVLESSRYRIRGARRAAPGI
jgi:hypothetical protein